MNQAFPTVWYATPARVRSITKWIVFDDRGPLEISGSGLQYKGKHYGVAATQILSVKLTRQSIAWVSFLIANALIVAYFLYLSPNRDQPVFLVSILIIANLFGLSVGMGTKWIQVEYEDASGQAHTAYFADGSALGWGGIFGGTSKLYHALRQGAISA
jgi:hypothetical protein